MIPLFDSHGETLRIECPVLCLELCRIYLSRKMALAEIGKSTGAITFSAFIRNRARLEEKRGKKPSLSRGWPAFRYVKRRGGFAVPIFQNGMKWISVLCSFILSLWSRFMTQASSG